MSLIALIVVCLTIANMLRVIVNSDQINHVRDVMSHRAIALRHRIA
jgi:hypothetical protein